MGLQRDSLISVAVAALLAAQAACRSDSTSPDSRGIRVEALTPTSLVGTVGTTASPPPAIRIVDAWSRRPVANLPVSFVASNADFITYRNVVTNSDGVASPGEWVFGTLPGDRHLTVRVNGSTQVSFKATIKPDVPAKLFSSDQPQAGVPGGTVGGPTVVVRDRFANAIPGIAVEFGITSGDGRLERGATTSDRNGVASAGAWVLGSQLGENVATARVPGFEPVTFTAQVLDSATLKWYRLDSVKAGSLSFAPNEVGITEARLGMTPFDPCLCKKQVGYFIDQQKYSYPGAQLSTGSGRYVLDGSTLQIAYLAEAGKLDSGRLELQKPDYDFGFLETWVYKEISSTPP